MFLSIAGCVGTSLLEASKKYEVINDILFGPREKLRTFKMLVSLIYGSVIGFLVHRYILCPFGIPATYSPLVAFSCCLITALLSSCSIQFRCVSVLLWLEVWGKASRNIIKAFVIALIIVGPFDNILSNSKELTRVIECTAYLTYNLSKSKFDLAVKPITNAFSYLEHNAEDVIERFRQIQDFVAPVLDEIENGNDNVVHIKYF